ncbi:hypothetical protein LBMAG27_12550 [Bacteroidota bacterium]|nr:hypothetical protein LBMAG27_12550 [Bacteroidota bacterium]
MKKQIVLIVAIIFSSFISFAQSPNDMSIIDAQDTVVFDIAHADSGVGFVEFPVYFLSGDTINALDFSFKYNQANFSYDTILKLASYLSITSNYNMTDSTVYFTSFSITSFANNTPLVKIRFTILSGQFCKDDLNNVLVYLNGDVCSVKITECIHAPNGIYEAENKNSSIEFYPNPSEGLTQMRFNAVRNQSYDLIVSDVNGKMVYKQSANAVAGENEMNLHLDFLSKGVYLVQVVMNYMNLYKKIVLQ